MTKAEKQAVLAAYYSSRERYETLAREIRRLFDSDIDPTVPAECIYTITHRLKDDERLVEKLEEDSGATPVTPENYADRVRDLLGMRIVCLRLSDVDRIEAFVQSLAEERRLRILDGPEHKRTFVLQVDPREELPRDIELQYTGYSSLHYLVGLGESLRPTEVLGGLRAELQVRTLLEEAWGEIDHKYRYEVVRSGTDLPDLVTRGFYSFAAYLQAAALQAEYLCMEVERVAALSAVREPEPPPTRRVLAYGLPVTPIRDHLRSSVGFVPTRRTVNYVARRLRDSKFEEEDLPKLKSEILAPEVLSRFTELYEEVAGRKPFADEEERDVDLINALNFGLVRRRQNDSVASAGARDVLTRRFRKGLSWELVFEGRAEPRMVIQAEAIFEPETTVSLADGTRWVVTSAERLEGEKVDGRVFLRPA